jgi:hypothetical protein
VPVSQGWTVAHRQAVAPVGGFPRALGFSFRDGGIAGLCQPGASVRSRRMAAVICLVFPRNPVQRQVAQVGFGGGTLAFLAGDDPHAFGQDDKSSSPLKARPPRRRRGPARLCH